MRIFRANEDSSSATVMACVLACFGLQRPPAAGPHFKATPKPRKPRQLSDAIHRAAVDDNVAELERLLSWASEEPGQLEQLLNCLKKASRRGVLGGGPQHEARRARGGLGLAFHAGSERNWLNGPSSACTNRRARPPCTLRPVLAPCALFSGCCRR